MVGAALTFFVVSFPFIAGDPGPRDIGVESDPRWFTVGGSIALGLLVVGGGVLLTLGVRRVMSPVRQ